MGKLKGKVAFITGAARGQGRSHAVRLAEEGADIIAVDVAQQLSTTEYPLATAEDLGETVRLVEALGRRIVAKQADVRNYDVLASAVDAGVSELGRLDIVVANAGIAGFGKVDELSEEQWREMIDVNLTGVWHTTKVAIRHLRQAGGGSIILTSSVAGLRGTANLAHYIAAKHGVVGLMRALAVELAHDRIRANSVHPTSVDTAMIHNDLTYALFAPDLAAAQRDRAALSERFASINVLPIDWVDPVDISNAVVWLASDDARYVTGVTLPVDAGTLVR